MSSGDGTYFQLWLERLLSISGVQCPKYEALKKAGKLPCGTRVARMREPKCRGLFGFIFLFGRN